MKITYYYVRHGETLFNVMGRLQGRCDAPLTAKGIHEAEDTASAMRHMPINAVYASSSQRAMDTAEILAAPHHLKVHGLKELKEFSFGRLDGSLYSEDKKELAEHADTDDWTDVGGENNAMFKARLMKALDIMNQNAHDGDHILMVSHGAYFGHMMEVLFHDDRYRARVRAGSGLKAIGNCHLAVFRYEDGKYTFLHDPMSADEIRAQHPKHVSFWYVRHGQTVFNAIGRIQGRCDSPLTDTGIAQAEKTAEVLKDVRFDRAYCSPSERTRDTAEILLRPHHMQAHAERRLAEVFFGTYEGRMVREVREETMRIHQSEDWSPWGGESAEDLERRIRDVLRDLSDEAEDGDQILLVSHALLYRNIVRFIFGMDRTAYDAMMKQKNLEPVPNAGIFRFDYDNGTFRAVNYMLDAENYSLLG